MSVNLTVNGTVYAYPSTGDEQWGSVTTNWASAVTTGMLQKAGGTFTLTADVNFGATFGLLSAYFSSRSSNPSSSGQFRLANADTGIGWRNAANSGNLLLTVNSLNYLTFNGVIVAPSVAYAASRAMVTDSSGAPTVSSTTSTQIGYLSGATGTTGTNTTNLVYSASPVLTGLITADATKTSSSNPSTAGIFRLSNTESIGWRNVAAAANILLAVSASDRLTLDTVNIPTISSTDTLTNKTISISSNTLTGVAPLASPTFTGTVTLPSGSVTSSAWSAGSSTLTTSGAVTFTGTTDSSSISTGILIVSGGAAVVKKLNVGSSITNTNDGTLNINMIGGSGTGQAIRFTEPGGSGNFNFQVANDFNTANIFEITPSTAANGSTFSNPSLRINGSTGVVTLGNATSFPNAVLALNGATTATGASTATMTNAPAGASGNPDIWMRITYNGTEYIFPGWTP